MAQRPEEWSQWAAKTRNGARQYDAIPFIADSADLGFAVAKWWNEMQPTFRKGDGNIPAAIYNTDDGSVWDPLRRSGPNGLVSIMTLLVWWGQALLDRTQYQTDSSVDWRRMVSDVKACFAVISSTTKMGKKRKSGQAQSDGSSKR